VPPGGQEADHDAAGIGGVRFADDHPSPLHALELAGEPGLLPLQQSAHFLAYAPWRGASTGPQEYANGLGDAGVVQ
jgi:hypothetical protein